MPESFPMSVILFSSSYLNPACFNAFPMLSLRVAGFPFINIQMFVLCDFVTFEAKQRIMVKKCVLLSLALLGGPLAAFSQELGLTISREFTQLGAVVAQAEFSPFRNYFVYTLGDNTARIYDRQLGDRLGASGKSRILRGTLCFFSGRALPGPGQIQGRQRHRHHPV
jgi:hypothetical protein